MNTQDALPALLRRALTTAATALAALAVLAVVPGCGDEDIRGINEAAENACEAACDASVAAGPGADDETCRALCGAYGITVDAGTACETAFLAWQACVENQAYECTTFDGTTYAIPEDLDACDAEDAARGDACN